MEEAKLPEPHAWLEIDEDALGVPVYRGVVHWTPDAIAGEHRRVRVFTADQMQAYGAECARLERERCATLCDSIYAEEQDEPECYGFAKECADAIRGARPMTHTPPKS